MDPQIEENEAESEDDGVDSIPPAESGDEEEDEDPLNTRVARSGVVHNAMIT